MIPASSGMSATCGWNSALDIAETLTLQGTILSKGGSSNEVLIDRQYNYSYYMKLANGQAPQMVINNKFLSFNTSIALNKLTTVTFTFDQSKANNTDYYLDDELIATGKIDTTLNARVGSNLPLNIGRGVTNATLRSDLFSIRIYNRALTLDEVKQNSAVDQKRFLAPPTVTIGGKSCTNVAVVSATQLQCTAPAGSAGNAVVTVTPSGGSAIEVNGGYTYVDNSSSYITGFYPPILPSFGDVILTATGNNLTSATVTSVTVGGVACTNIIIAADNKGFTCAAPPMQTAGDKDILIDGVLQGKVEYMVASKNPVNFNVEAE
jgi:hypothetical protein